MVSVAQHFNECHVMLLISLYPYFVLAHVLMHNMLICLIFLQPDAIINLQCGYDVRKEPLVG